VRKFLVHCAAATAVIASVIGVGATAAQAGPWTRVAIRITASSCYYAGDAAMKAGAIRDFHCVENTNIWTNENYSLFVIYA
jgi:hypothetical protein